MQKSMNLNAHEIWEEFAELIRAICGEHEDIHTLQSHQKFAHIQLKSCSSSLSEHQAKLYSAVIQCQSVVDYKRTLAQHYQSIAMLPGYAAGESESLYQQVALKKVAKVHRDQPGKDGYSYFLVNLINHCLLDRNDIVVRIVEGNIKILSTIQKKEVIQYLQKHFSCLIAEPGQQLNVAVSLSDDSKRFEGNFTAISLYITAYSLQMPVEQLLTRFFINPPQADLKKIDSMSFSDRSTCLGLVMTVDKMLEFLQATHYRANLVSVKAQVTQFLSDPGLEQAPRVQLVKKMIGNKLCGSAFMPQKPTVNSVLNTDMIDVACNFLETSKEQIDLVTKLFKNLKQNNLQPKKVEAILNAATMFLINHRSGRRGMAQEQAALSLTQSGITRFDDTQQMELLQAVMAFNQAILQQDALKNPEIFDPAVNGVGAVLRRYCQIVKHPDVDQQSIRRMLNCILEMKNILLTIINLYEQIPRASFVDVARRMLTLCHYLLERTDYAITTDLYELIGTANNVVVVHCIDQGQFDRAEHHLSQLHSLSNHLKNQLTHMDRVAITISTSVFSILLYTARGNNVYCVGELKKIYPKVESFLKAYAKNSSRNFVANIAMVTMQFNNLTASAELLATALDKCGDVDHARQIISELKENINRLFYKSDTLKKHRVNGYPNELKEMLRTALSSCNEQLNTFHEKNFQQMKYAFQESAFKCDFDEGKKEIAILCESDQFSFVIKAFGKLGLNIDIDKSKSKIYLNDFESCTPRDVKQLWQDSQQYQQRYVAKLEQTKSNSNQVEKNPVEEQSSLPAMHWASLFNFNQKQKQAKSKPKGKRTLLQVTNPRPPSVIQDVAIEKITNLSWGKKFPCYEANNKNCLVVSICNEYIQEGTYFAYIDREKVPSELFERFFDVLGRGNIVTGLNRSGVKFYKKAGVGHFKIKIAGHNEFIAGRVVATHDKDNKKHYLICFDKVMNHQQENRQTIML